MSIIHVNSLLWLFFGRRKSPSPTLHDESRIMHGFVLLAPPISVTKVVHSFAPTFLPGFRGAKISVFVVFFGTKKSLGIFDRGFSTPLNWGKLWGGDVFDLQMHLKKRMYWEEIWNLRAYIHMFGWYIKYTYSLYIHVWLIYFYIGSIGRLYIYLHGMVELFGEEN